MCNLCVLLPCFNSFDFLNLYFQPIRIKYLIKNRFEKQKGAKTLQEFCKNCKNSAKIPWKPPDGADPIS